MTYRQSKFRHVSCGGCGIEFHTVIYNKNYCSTKCQSSTWRIDNQEHRRIKQIEYRAIHGVPLLSVEQQQRHRIAVDKWKTCNKHKVKEYNRQYTFDRRHGDNNFKLAKNVRSRLSHALTGRKKIGSAIKDLGCSIDDLRIYLESKFTAGMTWDNYGHKGWHIDHIVPLSSYDLTNPNQLKKACHYTNLQPLWAKDNLSKGNKLEDSVNR